MRKRRVVELVRPGEMGDVAGVNHEGGLVRQSADLVDGLGQSGVRIGIGRLVEADVAVRNLDEGESRRGRFRRADEPGGGNAGIQRPDEAGAGPGRASERLPAVEGCVVIMFHYRLL